MPILDQGRTVGAVRVTQSNAAVGERVRRNVLVVVGVGLAALALGLALAWVLAGSLARPLRALARTARRVEDGELDARAEVTAPASSRRSRVAFNEMTERLAQVLEAQREFVGNASHQLRTPLTGLRLRLEAAGMKADDPAVRQELELAEAEVERLTRLLNSLLTLAREGDRPTLRAPVSLRARVRGGLRALAAARRGERPRARARRRRRRVRPGRRGGRRDRARQPDRERARLRAGRHDGDGDLGRAGPARRARRGPRRAGRGGAARLRALPARPHRSAGHAASASRSSTRSPAAGAARRRSGRATRAAPAPRSSCPLAVAS